MSLMTWILVKWKLLLIKQQCNWNRQWKGRISNRREEAYQNDN